MIPTGFIIARDKSAPIMPPARIVPTRITIQAITLPLDGSLFRAIDSTTTPIQEYWNSRITANEIGRPKTANEWK